MCCNPAYQWPVPLVAVGRVPRLGERADVGIASDPAARIHLARECLNDRQNAATLLPDQDMKSTPPHSKSAVDKAEKEIGAVLENLEEDTGGDVKDIGLEDVVDTDPSTGRPVIEKAVEVHLQDKPAKRWAK